MKNKFKNLIYVNIIFFFCTLFIKCEPSTNVTTPVVYSNTSMFTIDSTTLELENLVSVGNGIHKVKFYTKFNVEKTKNSDYKVFDILYDTIVVTQVILHETFQISYKQTDSLLTVRLSKGFYNNDFYIHYPDSSGFPKEFTKILK